jgi:hypothetical protein
MTSKLVLLATAGLILATAACGDPDELRARFETESDTLVVYALSGSPVGYPTALNTPFMQVLRAEGDLAFDVAFDIVGDSVALIPVQLVIGANPGRDVGILDTAATFDAITRAPSRGYNDSTVTKLARGGVAIIEAESGYCQFDLVQVVYSKLIIDDFDPATREISFRILVDPNCGFRSFLPGVPTR